jgi:phospholipid-binding lipoprotein MlaA
MRGRELRVAALAAGLALCLSGPADAQVTGAAVEPTDEEIARATTDVTVGSNIDPWEEFNRVMFDIHIILDDVLLVPASRVYRTVTPAKGRKGIRAFLANARTPGVLINDILQGEFRRAGHTASRFVINSTIGFGGFADPAQRLGVPGHSEDFGQTLAVWGLPSGPFLFLPLVGPGTVRDRVGGLVNSQLDPLNYIHTRPANHARIARGGATALAVREPLIEPLDNIRHRSLDYYASFRSFYLQARRREILNGRDDFDDLPDIGEYEEFDDLE